MVKVWRKSHWDHSSIELANLEKDNNTQLYIKSDGDDVSIVIREKGYGEAAYKDVFKVTVFASSFGAITREFIQIAIDLGLDLD